MELQKYVGFLVPAFLLASYAGLCWALTQVNGDCDFFQASCAVHEKAQARVVPVTSTAATVATAAAQ
jgi:hypothetical protein